MLERSSGSTQHVLMLPWIPEFNTRIDTDLFYRLFLVFDSIPHPRFSGLMKEMHATFRLISVDTSYGPSGDVMTKVILEGNPYRYNGPQYSLLRSFSEAVEYLARNGKPYPVAEGLPSLQSIAMSKGVMGGYGVNPIMDLVTEKDDLTTTAESLKEVITIKKEKEVKLNLIQL